MSPRPPGTQTLFGHAERAVSRALNVNAPKIDPVARPAVASPTALHRRMCGPEVGLGGLDEEESGAVDEEESGAVDEEESGAVDEEESRALAADASSGSGAVVDFVVGAACSGVGMR
jgi:hypothetical protein